MSADGAGETAQAEAVRRAPWWDVLLIGLLTLVGLAFTVWLIIVSWLDLSFDDPHAEALGQTLGSIGGLVIGVLGFVIACPATVIALVRRGFTRAVIYGFAFAIICFLIAYDQIAYLLPGNVPPMLSEMLPISSRIKNWIYLCFIAGSSTWSNVCNMLKSERSGGDSASEAATGSGEGRGG